MDQILGNYQPVISHQTFPRGCDSLLAVRCQRQVGDTGVSAIEGPLGFAVADDEAAGVRHFFSFLFFFLVCIMDN